MRRNFIKCLIYRFILNKHMCGIIVFMCGLVFYINSFFCIPDYVVGLLFMGLGGYLFLK